jgi:S-formylglutathione hydrolase FrmB
MRKLRFVFLLTLLLAPALAARAADTDCATCRWFHTQALDADRMYHIFLPPGYDENTDVRYPVIYLLHGYNFARNNPDLDAPAEEVNHWADQEKIPEIATCLMTESTFDAVDACLVKHGVDAPNDVVSALRGEVPDITLPLPPMIVVMPDGDNSFYMNRKDGKMLFPPEDGPDFVDGLYKGATGQHESYIALDLVAHIDSTYRTLADRGHRGIGGFSMGGIGSMFLLLRHPDIYSSVTSLSGVYTLSDWTSDPLFLGYAKDTTPEIMSLFTGGTGKLADLDMDYLQSYDPYYLLRDFNRTDISIYFDAGEKDAFTGMKDFKTIKKFSAGLEKKGLASSPAQHIIPATEGNGNGMHTGRYWRSRAGVILAFHAKAFGLLNGNKPAQADAASVGAATPRALAELMCRLAENNDMRGIIGQVHPLMLNDFLYTIEQKHGMPRDQFFSLLEQDAKANPVSKCTVAAAEEAECAKSRRVYKSLTEPETSLSMESCGAIQLDMFEGGGDPNREKMPVVKIGGQWYIDMSEDAK